MMQNFITLRDFYRKKKKRDISAINLKDKVWLPPISQYFIKMMIMPN